MADRLLFAVYGVFLWLLCKAEKYWLWFLVLTAIGFGMQAMRLRNGAF